MANLIKVEQVKEQQTGGGLDRYRPEETGLNILRQVLGSKFKLDFQTYQGVEFHFIKEEGWSYRDTPLAGIQMSVGGYGQKTIRRVMITKDGTIDADAIKTKFAKLRAEANDLAEREKRSADYYGKAQKLRDKIAKAVKHPDRYNFETRPVVDLSTHSPEEVEMEAHINGTQLLAIERIFGKQSVEIELKVPEDKAVEIYNILKGD